LFKKYLQLSHVSLGQVLRNRPRSFDFATAVTKHQRCYCAASRDYRKQRSDYRRFHCSTAV